MLCREPVLLAIRWRWRVLCSKLKRTFAPYQCPVCHESVFRFQPLDAALLKQYKAHGRDVTRIKGEGVNIFAYYCPYCRSADRERLYALYLRDWMPSLMGKVSVKFLDFAPSHALSGLIRALITELNLDCAYITTDLIRDKADVCADIQDLHPFGDESVDFLICSHVLEHVTDDRKAMQELRRVLKAGGSGIVMVPIRLDRETIDEDPTLTDLAERWRRFGQDDHVREYSKSGFVQRLEEAGFLVSQLGWRHFGKRTFKCAGIQERSVLYVVSK